MKEATSSTTNLQMQYNFRIIVWGKHMEPLKGFLSRCLRRRFVEAQINSLLKNKLFRSSDIFKVIDWIPKVWNFLNRFLEQLTSSAFDPIIGRYIVKHTCRLCILTLNLITDPNIFMGCPLDLEESRVWFIEMWNFSVAPYLLESIAKNLHVLNRNSPEFHDPVYWISETFPWPDAKRWTSHLTRIDSCSLNLPNYSETKNEQNDNPLVIRLINYND